MGGIKNLFSGPKTDNSAQKIAEENRRKAAEEARRAEEKTKALEEATRKRKANIAASGRKSTILAGESESGGNSFLGG